MQDDEKDLPADVASASPMTDDANAPQPVKRTDFLAVAGTAGLAVAIVGGVFFGVCTAVRPTMGGTRSAKIQWQSRNRQIEQAMQDAKSGNGSTDCERPRESIANDHAGT